MAWRDAMKRDRYTIAITWPSNSGLANSQHRGCTPRLSRAQKVAVVVSYETIVEDFADWTYLGDG